MSDNASQILANFNEAAQVSQRFISSEQNIESIERAAALMAEAIAGGGKIISCGNGGSMCDAMHFAEELSGRFRNDRRALPAIAASDASHLTCTANDYGFENVFSRFVEALGRKGDVLLAISASGNSANVVKAVEIAKLQGLHVVGLTGRGGGLMYSICDLNICVLHDGYADRVQEVHIKIIHTLIQLIEQRLCPKEDRM
ncbi:MAG: D-sedoheptulose 7-phosphate isomerase [Prevotellaceae bacterium]|jgi:D-sedoheptulose 7-phosphate isomerase|nr:D-sedoheptulose 7-phosphate isomerase [Prevotellaceae bacterium]